MKAMVLAFAAAILVAVGAGYVLNAGYQQTADSRFVGSGAQLRGGEAGYNLVGKDWSGINPAPTTTR
jgi:hypothetical protein